MKFLADVIPRLTQGLRRLRHSDGNRLGAGHILKPAAGVKLSYHLTVCATLYGADGVFSGIKFLSAALLFCGLFLDFAAAIVIAERPDTDVFRQRGGMSAGA